MSVDIAALDTDLNGKPPSHAGRGTRPWSGSGVRDGGRSEVEA